MKHLKAISLFSGGLDSQLAVCLIKQQRIEVEAVNFKSPFFGGDVKLAEAADNLGVTLTTLDISEEYMAVLKNPKYGFGKNMNPCIDCHAFMIRKAGEYMQEVDAHFIITGEVLGQRPMSQNRSSLDAVDKLSGFRGHIVRPLSALLLKPTIPEVEGWLKREELLDISGRSRVRQIELAEQLGISDYPSPAGGCLLTTENYSRRLRHLLDLKPDIGPRETEVLKYGRHFLLENRALLIVGRKAAENEAILNLAEPKDYLFKVATHPGPTSMLRYFGHPSEEDITWAAAVTARYSDAIDLPIAKIKVWQLGQSPSIREVKPFSRELTPTAL
ncbi:MAG: tRNA 4-thiouridine(8) synthase ThiI [Syntrophomonadaceae bacterium]|nr:tRNA 4-thiouridine(8) synthase ThiI [Syntrophomonadaceae bacterium]